MPSERISRVIERLLDEAELAAISEDWSGLRASTDKALELDSTDADALALRAFGVSQLPRDAVAEFQGVDVDDATDTALRELGLARNDVDIEILIRGLRGIGRSRRPVAALIRVTYDMPDDSASMSAPLSLTTRTRSVIEGFLDEAEQRVAEQDWNRVRALVRLVRLLDEENVDAASLSGLAESRLRGRGGPHAPARRKPPPATAERDAERSVPATASVVASRPSPQAGAPPPAHSPRRASAMTFGRAVESGFDNYAEWDGRASRSAYWYWALFAFLFQFAMLLLDAALGTTPWAYAVASVVLFFPSLTLAVRRLHDVNKTGWNMLWVVVPLVGAVYLFVLSVTEGTQGPNKYGAAADE